MRPTVWYLYHSGFAVKTAGHFLIFDYWRDTPGKGLDSGAINPKELVGQDVIVFVSHRHGDHYNPVILNWWRELPGLRYVLSDDVPSAPGALMASKNKTYKQSDFTVETFASTDEGVAFLVCIDGLRIYHAGDLNWWHWAGESDSYNAQMSADYRGQIDLLGKEPIDLAFVPVDPRLEEQYALGIDYLMRSAQVRCAVPMHFGQESAVVERLLADPVTAGYRERILPLTRRGQSVLL